MLLYKQHIALEFNDSHRGGNLISAACHGNARKMSIYMYIHLALSSVKGFIDIMEGVLVMGPAHASLLLHGTLFFNYLCLGMASLGPM